MGDLKPVSLANGISLDVWEEGPKDAPALIFLHGFPESHRTWRHQIAHLAPRFRCIAPDLRGYGGSFRPAEVEAYATPALVGDVFALADALGVSVGFDSFDELRAAMIAEVVGYQGNILYDSSQPDGTPRKVLDVSVLTAMGWTVGQTLKERLRSYYAWFLDHLDSLRT